MAMNLPGFSDWKIGESALWKRAVVFLSMISYSVYLGHIFVMKMIDRFLNTDQQLWQKIWFWPSRLYPLYLIGIFLFAPLTYYLWEKPFLRLRDRYLS
jgi:peptidoglycan/LPS O-acetylase OafA/YrhL